MQNAMWGGESIKFLKAAAPNLPCFRYDAGGRGGGAETVALSFVVHSYTLFTARTLSQHIHAMYLFVDMDTMLILRNIVIYAAFHCSHHRIIRTIHVGVGGIPEAANIDDAIRLGN